MAQDQHQLSELLDKSLRLHRAGNLELARSGYLEILQQHPDHPAALNLLGSLDAQQGNLTDAERLIRKAIVQNPKEAAYYSNLANVLQQQQRPAEAVVAYQHALKLDPQLGDAHNNVGVLLLEGGEPGEALKYFEQALAISGEAPEVCNNLGRALNNLGRLDEAAEKFTRAVELNPGFAPAHLNLGYVLRSQRRFTYAAASFQNAIEQDPGLQRAYHALGTVFMAQNTPEAAQECFEKALELKPDDFDTLLDLGVLLHSLGKLHQSVTTYKQAIKINPRSAVAFNNLGAVLLERRNLKAAESAFRQAIQIDPSMVDPYARLGAMFDEQGRTEEMQAVIEGGLQIDPDHRQLNFEAARLAQREGNFDRAVELLTRFDLKAMNERMAQQYRYELGRACDRAGDPGLAFLHATEANRLAMSNWRASSVDLEKIPRSIEALQNIYSGKIAWQQAPADQDAPIFLLGFPGSGVEFIAQILRRHAGLQATIGPSALSAAVGVAGEFDTPYPQWLASPKKEQLERLRTIYFAQVEKLQEREQGTRLLDNQTINTMHLGLMLQMFPGARFIFMVRHPCDVVLSNFFQNYSMNDTNAHFLTLDSTVTLYEKLMLLWQSCEDKLPFTHYTLRYEALADNLEREIAGLLEHVGLQVDDGVRATCERLREGDELLGSSYRLHSNPMDKASLFRWQAYRDQLGPYLKRLQPFVTCHGYDPETGAGSHTS